MMMNNAESGEREKENMKFQNEMKTTTKEMKPKTHVFDRRCAAVIVVFVGGLQQREV
jgi:hypothetical protein